MKLRYDYNNHRAEIANNDHSSIMHILLLLLFTSESGVSIKDDAKHQTTRWQEEIVEEDNIYSTSLDQIWYITSNGYNMSFKLVKH